MRFWPHTLSCVNTELAGSLMSTVWIKGRKFATPGWRLNEAENSPVFALERAQVDALKEAVDGVNLRADTGPLSRLVAPHPICRCGCVLSFDVVRRLAAESVIFLSQGIAVRSCCMAYSRWTDVIFGNAPTTPRGDGEGTLAGTAGSWTCFWAGDWYRTVPLCSTIAAHHWYAVPGPQHCHSGRATRGLRYLRG